jgi:AcrR family transcriptional regulator
MNPEHLRETIVQAAMPLITEWDTVTTAQIARAAGIDEATLLRVFNDKDAVLTAAIQVHVMTALDPTQVAQDLQSTWTNHSPRAWPKRSTPSTPTTAASSPSSPPFWTPPAPRSASPRPRTAPPSNPSVAAMSGTITVPVASATTAPARRRLAHACVVHASASGITISVMNALTNGPTSTVSAKSDPTNTSRNTGNSSICAISSSGVAASSCWLLPPARPLNTIT